MLQIAIALLLSQANPVKIVNPTNQSRAATTTTVGQKEAIDVNCVGGCTGGGGAGGSGGGASVVWIDGGRLGVDVLTIAGPDGGRTLDVSGSSVSCSGPVTDTQIRSTPLPVSGSLTCSGPVTDAQLRASAVPVSLASTTITGTVATSGPATDAQLRSTPLPVSGTLTCNAGSGTLAVSLATAPTTPVTNAGLSNLDALLSTRTKPSDQQHVIVDSSASLTCTGPLTDTQIRASALPVSLASVPTHAVTLTSTTITSGTVTANVGLGIDGGRTVDVTGSSVYAVVGFDGGLVSISNLDVALSTRTKPADQQHTIIDSAATLTVTGPATDTQLRATPLPVSGTVTATVTGATGTMTCNAGTNLNTSALALDATLTGGALKTKIVDTGGSTAATVKAASTAAVATDTALVVAQAPTGGNPCQNPSATVVGLSGVTSGTASVQLQAISGSTKIYVCSLNVTGVSGTTPTFKLQYGTGSVCGTGTVGIIGPFTSTANTVFSFGGTAGVAVTPAGQALCYVQTGTTPVSNYNITLVQQ